jgi:hypothetical protein
MTLFINFYYGDFYGAESTVASYFKTLLPIFTLLLGIVIQRILDRYRENRKNKLKLFNFNEHLKHIIKNSDTLVPVFRDFSKEILKTPFEEHILRRRITLPDIYRILEINKDDVFSGYLLKYRNKVHVLAP